MVPVSMTVPRNQTRSTVSPDHSASVFAGAACRGLPGRSAAVRGA